MRFSLAEAMCDPTHYLPLAVAADEAGYTSYVIPDSICYPKASDTKYPYTDEGDRDFLVGLSPWPEDFQVCGQEWKSRGKRMDEMIEIIRGLTQASFFEYHGKYYDTPSIKMCPVPTQPIPILIGGHSEPALRRAARLGDGWLQAGRDDFEPLIARLAALRKEYGREREPFEIHVISFEGYSVDGVHRLEDLGVTDLIVGLRYVYDRSTDSMNLSQKIDALRTYADNVIRKA